MSEQIREAKLEADIEEVLLKKREVPKNQAQEADEFEYRSWGEPGGFNKRTSEDYDKALCLIPKDLTDFIKATQPKAWQKFVKFNDKSSAEEAFCALAARKIEKKGTIYLLRNGMRASGAKFQLYYPRPRTGLNPESTKKYQANYFSLIRQFYYSEETKQSLDLGIFLNGIPLFTAELKNPLNNQDVEDAKAQYKNDRDSKEPIFEFKRCLAHFAVDPQEVWYTTQLKKDSTYFLPFNKGKAGGAGNPTSLPGEDYATSYLWKEIWSKDSILDLVQHFIHVLKDETNKETLIFPRFHQLKAVRRMVNHTGKEGAGKQYLVQHSAGSGKSNTIAWLAHQLSSLHNTEDENIFDTVIVITDRRVLDKQLRDIILQYERIPGIVEPIGNNKTSADLKKALENKKKIITTTLQKFPVIAEAMEDFRGSTFAVLIDEAHSSMAGESTRKMNQILSPISLEKAQEEDDVEEEDLTDRIESLVKSRGQLPNVSYYAFTATPKNKTLELFGTKNAAGKPEPFSVYTMRQAIEEDFIMDVLENYTTYTSYFKLLKAVKNDPRYDQSKASSLLKAFVNLHEHAITQKVEIIAEHFHQYVSHAIDKKAKAMIVTRSRLHAVRFYLSLKNYFEEHNYPYKAIVAFSGTVKDQDTNGEYTEAGLNGFPDTQTKEQFKRSEYRFMVVANKFQTGFDQPLLHTMYVDKKLGGVNAVQTLSRLNRTCANKKDTIVLDFANDADQIKESFDPYYEKTFLSETTDKQVPYQLMEDLYDFNLFSELDADQFAEHYFKNKVKQSQLYAVIEPVRDRFKELGKDEQRDFHRKMMKYVRTYSFLSQILPFDDANLEKFYAFGKYLLRFITLKRETLPREVTQEVDMDSYRIQRMFEGKINLERGKGEINPNKLDGEGKSGGKKETLSEIIRILNERYGTSFTDADKVFDNFRKRLYNDEAVQKSYKVNTQENAQLTFKDKANEHAKAMIDEHFDFFKKYNDDDDFREALTHMFFNDFKSWMQEGAK